MKKIFAILTIVLTIGFVGCEDFLVEAPLLTQSSELTMSTYGGLDNAIAGAYAPLVHTTWYGSFFVLDAEMRSGNAIIPTNTDFTSGRMRLPHDLSYSSTSTSGLWGWAYYTISMVNNVIENLEGKDVGGVTEQDLNNLKAEALFIRALSHFDALRLYALPYSKNPNGPGVPIILYTDKTASEQPARNTVAEVFEQIIEDLLEAEEIIAPSYVRSGVADAKAVATLPAIQALLSRVYLYSQNWQAAADYATKVIENSKFNLWDAEEYVDKSTWGAPVAASSGEVIFEVYGKQANFYDAWWEGPSHMTNPKGYADCAAHPDLVSLYEADDVRGELFRTDEEEVSGSMWTTKYIGKGDGDAVSTPDANNVIVLRLSEMYLNRAEAIINGASIAGATALGDLNKIRENRGAPALASAGSDVVFAERRKELAFEGHLWFDYARTNRAMTRTKSDGSVVSLASDDGRWALPIPQRELDVNDNLIQNEGY
ncbi:RagB/SusD family nutrient uptake outer membrane protein [Perlabentimonas gracilis]|uniref:RagB/SusD family nutrient uptake outer membrane protein n=1 Tax=Perlabentimonas gracilis TaxID=2715279 RepID=UPI00140AE265|nr:RagB/SusD family nutrient uptake outer membrane protein [Perlabentimonas gracilis]NHB70158.1 RagB/SusD family nutrient uptake outer membrane protein [Perlabentimonas gracilis]